MSPTRFARTPAGSGSARHLRTSGLGGGVILHLGVDLDGVLGDILAVSVQALNDYFGREVRVEEVRDYDLSRVYGLSREEIREFFAARQDLLEEMPPMPGARLCLEYLYRHCRLTIITARPPFQEDMTRHWLARYGFPYHDLVLVGSHDKREACRRAGIDLFIDDRLENALMLASEGWPVILFAAPHNRASELPAGVVRLQGWEAIYPYLRRCLEGAALAEIRGVL